MMSSGSSFGSSGEQFPDGLRVLVVDDDVTCLKILEDMLYSCRYRVTTCCQATVALSLLRERRGGFDVVIINVHMPDMNGFKLLELVGLEMDLPVIMMSADGGTNTVMRGIEYGACDFLIKPVRIDELKNIWQHVIRKKWNKNRELEYSGSMDDSDCSKRVADDTEYASSVNDGADGLWKSHKKKTDAKEEEEDDDDGEVDDEDPSSKKPRVVWSVELHQQFVSAVSQLGIEKAVPKRIIELMNVPGLTKENVASHLQTFRLYLKRISISKQLPPTSVAVENSSSGFLAWPSNHFGTTHSIKNLGGLNNTQNGNIMMPILQQQQQPYHVITKPHHVIDVLPSCLVVPSQSSNSVDVGQSSLPLKQNSTVIPSQLSKTWMMEEMLQLVRDDGAMKLWPTWERCFLFLLLFSLTILAMCISGYI